jgi:high-affinity iron transporter
MPASTIPANPAVRPASRSESRWFYVWLATILGLVSLAVVLGWNAAGGTVDPTDAGRTLSRTTVVVNSAVLVLREGLECILVLAAITAGLRGPAAGQRRPIAVGGAVAFLLSIVTWFAAVWFIGAFGDTGVNVQAATGIPAIVVLLLIMNWFFHDTYWTGWIKRHNRKKKGLLHAEAGSRRLLLGLGLLGFTAVYREGFEIVLFLQSLRVGYGSSVVLEGVTLGLLFTAAAGVVTFVLHRKLPYKKLLIITFALLVLVLFVMVGEQVNEMQLAGWIGTSTFWDSPGWLGTWFSIFGNWETVIGQTLAVGAVVGSYVVAREVQVKGPQRRARRAAQAAPFN